MRYCKKRQTGGPNENFERYLHDGPCSKNFMKSRTYKNASDGSYGCILPTLVLIFYAKQHSNGAIFYIYLSNNSHRILSLCLNNWNKNGNTFPLSMHLNNMLYFCSICRCQQCFEGVFCQRKKPSCPSMFDYLWLLVPHNYTSEARTNDEVCNC